MDTPWNTLQPVGCSMLGGIQKHQDKSLATFFILHLYIPYPSTLSFKRCPFLKTYELPVLEDMTTGLVDRQQTPQVGPGISNCRDLNSVSNQHSSILGSASCILSFAVFFPLISFGKNQLIDLTPLLVFIQFFMHFPYCIF